MKKSEYFTPEFELVKLSFTNSVLAASDPEEIQKPDPGDDPGLDLDGE